MSQLRDLVERGFDFGQQWRTKSFTVIGADGVSSVTMKPRRKGEVFLFLFMGYEPLKVGPTETSDPTDVINGLGLVSLDDVAKALAEAGASKKTRAKVMLMLDTKCATATASVKERMKL